MQLRKFYGRTVSAALAQVKRELGPDALILETILLTPENPAVRLHPDARYEILAARDTHPAPAAQPTAKPSPAQPRQPALQPGLVAAPGRERARSREWEQDREWGYAEKPAARSASPAPTTRPELNAAGNPGLAGGVGSLPPTPRRPAQAMQAYQGNQGYQAYPQSSSSQKNLSDRSDRTDRSDESIFRPRAGSGVSANEKPANPFAQRTETWAEASVRAAENLPGLKRVTANAPQTETSAGVTKGVGVDYDDENQSQLSNLKFEIDNNPQSAIRNPQSPFRLTAGLPNEETEHELNKILRGMKPAVRRGKDVLEDLGLLRSQLNDLLDGDLGSHAIDPAHLDLSDYHALIELGVEHEVLAPHFRAWLEWRTAPAAHRRWIAQLQSGPAARMQGESLREWLWLGWTDQLGMGAAQSATRTSQGPHVTALLGSTGSGKTTTLAKLASIKCHQYRQNAVILTLDTFRFGATEQWRRMARLMGIEVEEIVSQADISRSMERWNHYDWIGIDTPGGLTPDSAAGILYGSILAHYRDVESVVVLPATQRESVSREQMKRYRGMGARKALFSKMDESMHNGSIINLTIDGKWNINGFATGCRIPEDWECANPETLWRRVLTSQTTMGGVA